MRKTAIDKISSMLKINMPDKIEKDVIIHEILADLSDDDFFSDNLVFKGGTCLVKAYLGYYRFSEDMDFTWKNQDVFKEKSRENIRREISKYLEKIGKTLEDIATKRELCFKYEKNNKKYVMLGGSNKMATFFILYDSEVTGKEVSLKIQINFVECLLYPLQNKRLKSLASGKKELEFFAKSSQYNNEIKFDVYDIKEILCEKIRAILTRRGIKTRDFLDIYLICKKYGMDLDEVNMNATKKLGFSLQMYAKYRENLKNKIDYIKTGKGLFVWEDGMNLLEKIDMDEFYSFNKKLESFLGKIIQNAMYTK